jgi:hypothetical protein
MTTQVDPTVAPGVGRRVSSSLSAALAACLLLLAPACGGKDKPGTTTPAAGGGAAGGGANGGGELGEAGGGEAGGDAAFGPIGGGGAAGGGAAGGGAGEPTVRPPGVDLTPAQQKEKVATNVKRGQAALAGAAPQPDVAIEAAKVALAADETSVDAMVLLAHANYLKGFDDQAEDILLKAFKRGGAENKQAHFVMGLIYDRTKRPE